MTRLTAFLILLLVSPLNRLAAQANLRHNTFSYGVNEGLLQSAMIDMAFDRNNFAWISFPNGIQKFDGKNFYTVPLQPGLPEDKSTGFFVTQSKELLITHSKGISWYDISKNIFRQIYFNPANITGEPLLLGEDEGVIYFSISSGTVTGISVGNFNIAREFPNALPAEIAEASPNVSVSENIMDHRVCIYNSNRFYLLDLQSGKLAGQSPGIGSTFHYATNLRMKSSGEIYFFSREPELYLNTYDFATGRITRLIKGPVQSARTFRSTMLFWNGIPYLTNYNELYQCSDEFKSISGRVVTFQNAPPAGEAPISGTRQDNYGNLYVLTINKGFRKVLHQNYPIKYFGSGDPDKNYFMRVFADKQQNRVLASAYTGGILVFDTLQRLVRHFDKLPGTNTLFTPSAFLKLADGSYLVFVSGFSNPWRLTADLSAIKMHELDPSPDNSKANGYCSNPEMTGPGNAIIFSEGGLYKVNTITGHTVYRHDESITATACVAGGNYLTYRDNQLLFIDTATLKPSKRISFPNTGGVRCYLNDGEGKIYIGTNKGIFIITYDGRLIQQVGRSQGLPDECIYAMTRDADGAIWCSTNRGILKMGKDLSILQLRKEDGLQENEFNTEGVYRSGDNEIFFAGINGASSFHPSEINAYPDSLQVLLTGLRVNNDAHKGDTAVWNIGGLTLPHNQNMLSLEFLAMGFNSPDQYIYQYRMLGIEEEWMQGSSNLPVRYYLNPGKYRFQLFASRQFDPHASPMKEIVIVIKPPFYITWWFISAAAFLLIALLTISINLSNRRKFQKKLQLLENEKQMKLERERISRDLHDNLGAYANAVLHSSQLLENEQVNEKRERLVGDLKFASRDIITSLKETVWALNDDEFSGEECLLRIRNFMYPLSRYYPTTAFSVTGNAPANLKLHSANALNLVRIVQEAISNSLKHAEPANICVSSGVGDNEWTITVTDDGKGFSVNETERSGQGNGLYNMKSRATESGFSLSVVSIPTGTSITIKLKYPDPHP